MSSSEIRKWRDFEKKRDADESKWKEFENYAWNVFKGSRWNGNDRKKEIWESYI